MKGTIMRVLEQTDKFVIVLNSSNSLDFYDKMADRNLIIPPRRGEEFQNALHALHLDHCNEHSEMFEYSWDECLEIMFEAWSF